MWLWAAFEWSVHTCTVLLCAFIDTQWGTCMYVRECMDIVHNYVI